MTNGHYYRYQLENDRNIWDRQSKEPEHTYGMFTHYLLMHKPRDLRLVADFFQVTIHSIRKTHQRWNWRERSEAYDAQIVDKVAEQQVDIYMRVDKKLIADEQADYDMMLTDWRRMYQAAVDVQDLKAMSQLLVMREQIDVIGRRSVSLPKTYKDHGQPAGKESDKPLELGWHDAPLTIPGNVNESNSSATAAREADAYQE